MKHLFLPPLLVTAILAGTVGVFGAETTSTAAAKANAKAAAPAPADVQKLIDQFNAQRDTVIADRQALLNQLKNATTEQRKAILEKMQAQQKDLVEAQRALGKQIRDDLRSLRPGSAPSGGR